MNDKKFLIGITLITLFLIAGGVYFVSITDNAVNIKSVEGVRALALSTSHDWGNIKIDGGNVKAVFDIKNEGEKTMKLFNVKTSCMCTTAQLKLDDNKSPVFGMHTKSSYVLDVPPGKTAKLEMIFDPAYHGSQGIGPITREVIVETNDPKNPKLIFTANAVVTK